ncbi:MAG: helix-turn-helix domain-containing protein [Gallintestinimicrobium sp.]|uniref:helix-turn-helix domain-containing protein n=1 Tax=Gallintestinimicrobium sp. TaxID=2981655 RepID=UPI00399A1C1B
MWAMQQIMFKDWIGGWQNFSLLKRSVPAPTRYMTHEQIAQHISSAREAVARMLKSFSRRTDWWS